LTVETEVKALLRFRIIK